MSNTPFFSIITCTLNNRSTIQKMITSVGGQTFPWFEHIIIDGASRDGTTDILRSMSKRHRIHWISESDRGIAHALNKGLKLSKGNYIFTLQGDDRLSDSNVLSRVYNELKNETSDIYSYPVLKEMSNRQLKPYPPIRLLWWYHFKTIFPHQGCFVHRRVFDHIGQFREEFEIAMDYDFFYRALASGATVKFGTFPVAIMGGQGISSDPAMLEKRLREESLVQRMNEKKLFWRMAQKMFHAIYFPYKTRLAQKLNLS